MFRIQHSYENRPKFDLIYVFDIKPKEFHIDNKIL